MLDEIIQLSKLLALVDATMHVLDYKHLEDEDKDLEKELRNDLQYYSNTLYVKIEELKKRVENGS